MNEGGNTGGVPPNEQSYSETKAETVRTSIPIVRSNGICPSGYLPNGQGKCCSPFTGDCKDELSNQSVVKICRIYYTRGCNKDKTDCTPWRETDRECTFVYIPEITGEPDSGGGGSGGGGGGGSGGTPDCVGGRSSSTGQACGPSICSTIDGRDQYGNGCGAPKCNAQSGLTNYKVLCNTKINTADVKKPCLQAALASIAQAMKNLPPDNDSFLGQLKAMFGQNGNFNLTFKESSSVIGSDGKQVAAQTSDLNPTDNTITITLNTSILPGTTGAYQIMTILHEAMHAYMRTLRNSPSHSEMAGTTFLLPLVRAVQDMTGLGGRDALALCLYGMSDAQNSSNFINALDLSAPPLIKQNVIDIGKTNSKAVLNSDGTTKEGGSDCGN